MTSNDENADELFPSIKMAGRKVGRPTYQPTDADRRIVDMMAAVGIRQDDIAACLKIDKKTLTKHFRDDLDTAMIRANVEIGGALFSKAIRGDTSALIFWAKTRMNWKETSRTEHAGADGKDLMWGLTPKP